MLINVSSFYAHLQLFPMDIFYESVKSLRSGENLYKMLNLKLPSIKVGELVDKNMTQIRGF